MKKLWKQNEPTKKYKRKKNYYIKRTHGITPHENYVMKKELSRVIWFKNHKITYLTKNVKITNYVSFPFKIFTNFWNEKIVIKVLVLIIAPIVLYYSIGDLFLIFS